jgi:predicted dienelactone hydrolase
LNKNILVLIIAFILPELCIGQSYRVGESTLYFTDSTRNRPLKTELWYPTADIDTGNQRATELPFILEPTIRNASFIAQKHPLLLISHGTGGNRFSLAWLAIALVKQGYMVAAPDHWGNTYDNKIPEYFVRYWERPLDISFVLSQLLLDKTLSESIDFERIGAVGFSFGGYISLALAGVEMDCNLLKSKAETNQGKKEFNVPELGDLRKLIEKLPCDRLSELKLKDSRIKAFVALSPALGLGVETLTQTKNVTAPILIIAPANDRIAPVLTNARNYNALILSSKYVELLGNSGHYIFLNQGNESLKKEAKKYYKDEKGVDRDLVHKNIQYLVLQFFAINLKN